MAELLAAEAAARVATADYNAGFQARADQVKNDLLAFLIEARRAGRKVAAYGPPPRGITLLNYAGVRPDLLPWVVDRNPAKQGRFLPGSRIPIVTEARLREEKPDIVLILPWNLQEEIMDQLSYVREWGGWFVTAVPAVVVRA